MPVSLRFFLIAVIFLIFDIELVLLFPFLVSLVLKAFSFSYLVLLIFFLILILGLFFEWSQGILEWADFNWIFKKNFIVNKTMALGPVKSQKT